MTKVLENVKAVTQLRAKGLTLQKIAQRLGISTSTVWRASLLGKFQLTPPVSKTVGISNERTPAHIENQVRNMREGCGMTYTAIGLKMGLPQGTVWRICNRERSRAICRDSAYRYRLRGRVALVDVVKG